MFDENKIWKWCGERKTSNEEEESFILDFGAFIGERDDDEGLQGNGSTRAMEGTDEHETNHEEDGETEGFPYETEDGESEVDLDDQTEVRRSTRVRRKPEYLSDYICLA